MKPLAILRVVIDDTLGQLPPLSNFVPLSSLGGLFPWFAMIVLLSLWRLSVEQPCRLADYPVVALMYMADLYIGGQYSLGNKLFIKPTNAQ